MRNINTIILFILTALTVLLPLTALPSPEKAVDTAAIINVSKAESSVPKAKKSKDDTEKTDGETVRLYMAESKQVEKVEMRKYLFGVMAAECPMSYSEEAIKAQIVAAHTYTLYRMSANKKEKYDVSTEPATSQAWLSDEKIKQNWGANYDKYAKKLSSLINDMMPYVMTYKGKPILAVYHAISGGMTESAENVWGNKCDYLKPVQSIGDKLSVNYLSEVQLTVTEADKVLSSLGITAKELAAAKFSKTESGTVTKAVCGKKTVTGDAIREALGLRSANFDILLIKNQLVATVRGYGHLVGMSQNGANYMAKNGDDFTAILTHYYSGIKIEKR